MSVRSIISVVRTAVLLGRFFVSETSASEREQLRSRLGAWDGARKSALFGRILDEKELEHRRRIRAACDVDGAWRSVQARLEARRGRTLFMRRVFCLGSAAAVAAVLLVAGGLLCDSHFGRRKRIMDRIAMIRPAESRATLYLSDGQCVDLGAPHAQADLGNARISGENSLTYMRTAASGRAPLGDADSPEERYDVLVTPRGCTCEVTLADGTRVWVNAASQLRFFTANRGAERLVSLEGEAYFEVAHDAGRPFVVESGGQRIRVLGTHFNVRAYDSDPIVHTTLVEGSVEVSSLCGGPHVRLAPGEQAAFDRRSDGPIGVTCVDPSLALAWRSGHFVFSHATVSEILEELSRWYPFEYEVAPALDCFRFTGQFPRCGELDRILEIIASSDAGMEIDYDGERITLK